MEKRRLQATGGRSLTLTLPKSWVDTWQLQSKDEVLVNTSGASLIVRPSKRTNQRFAKAIDLNSKKPEWILREIIGAYVSGAHKIVLEGDKISPTQNRIIRQTVRELFGFEILEETSSKIAAHSVINDTKYPVEDNAKRAYTICRQMLEDTLTAAQTGDKDLAYEVMLRDQELNMLVYAIERRLTQTLEGRVEGNSIEINYYCNVALQLERIGDRAAIIGGLVKEGRAEVVQLSQSFPDIREALVGLLDDIENLLQNPNIVLAHHILDKNPELSEVIYSSNRIKKIYEGAVVEDSLDRCRGRLMNIAELTIDYLIQK